MDASPTIAAGEEMALAAPAPVHARPSLAVTLRIIAVASSGSFDSLPRNDWPAWDSPPRGDPRR